jgi:hypothetical protein
MFDLDWRTGTTFREQTHLSTFYLFVSSKVGQYSVKHIEFHYTTQKIAQKIDLRALGMNLRHEIPNLTPICASFSKIFTCPNRT